MKLYNFRAFPALHNGSDTLEALGIRDSAPCRPSSTAFSASHARATLMLRVAVGGERARGRLMG